MNSPVILITGSSSGIGRSIALHYAAKRKGYRQVYSSIFGNSSFAQSRGVHGSLATRIPLLSFDNSAVCIHIGLHSDRFSSWFALLSSPFLSLDFESIMYDLVVCLSLLFRIVLAARSEKELAIVAKMCSQKDPHAEVVVIPTHVQDQSSCK